MTALSLVSIVAVIPTEVRILGGRPSRRTYRTRSRTRGSLGSRTRRRMFISALSGTGEEERLLRWH